MGRTVVVVVVRLLWLGLLGGVTGSCEWWSTQQCEGELALGLVFVHMRKAGGTHVLSIIDEWFHDMHCAPKGKTVNTRGVVAGKTSGWDNTPGDKPSRKAICPHVDIVHNEFECMGRDAMKSIPSFGVERVGYNVSFFTTFRHPIGRVVSQAFYSGVASDAVSQHVRSTCPDVFPSKSKDYNIVFNAYSKCKSYGKIDSKTGKIVVMPKYAEKKCECVIPNHELALENLRTNETLWFNWLKNRNGFSDQYVDNYYIKRLFINSSFAVPKRKCASTDCDDMRGLRKLDNFMHRKQCLLSDYTLKKGFSLASALEYVKVLLRDKFDFLILEKLHDPRTLTALERIFHKDISHKSNVILQHDRKGVGHNTSTDVEDSHGRHDIDLNSIGSDVMPPSVQKYLYEKNSIDIALYNYAVELFLQRYS